MTDLLYVEPADAEHLERTAERLASMARRSERTALIWRGEGDMPNWWAAVQCGYWGYDHTDYGYPIAYAAGARARILRGEGARLASNAEARAEVAKLRALVAEQERCPDPRGCDKPRGHAGTHYSRTLGQDNNVIEDEWQTPARVLTCPVCQCAEVTCRACDLLEAEVAKLRELVDVLNGEREELRGCLSLAIERWPTFAVTDPSEIEIEKRCRRALGEEATPVHPMADGGSGPTCCPRPCRNCGSVFHVDEGERDRHCNACGHTEAREPT